VERIRRPNHDKLEIEVTSGPQGIYKALDREEKKGIPVRNRQTYELKEDVIAEEIGRGMRERRL